jgi:hypothetical protein
LTNSLCSYDSEGKHFIDPLLHIATLEGYRDVAMCLSTTLRTWKVLERQLERMNLIIIIQFVAVLPDECAVTDSRMFNYRGRQHRNMRDNTSCKGRSHEVTVSVNDVIAVELKMLRVV